MITKRLINGEYYYAEKGIDDIWYIKSKHDGDIFCHTNGRTVLFYESTTKISTSITDIKDIYELLIAINLMEN